MQIATYETRLDGGEPVLVTASALFETWRHCVAEDVATAFDLSVWAVQFCGLSRLWKCADSSDGSLQMTPLRFHFGRRCAIIAASRVA